MTKGSLDGSVKTVRHAAAHPAEQGIERVTAELIAYPAYYPPLAAVRPDASEFLRLDAAV